MERRHKSSRLTSSSSTMEPHHPCKSFRLTRSALSAGEHSSSASSVPSAHSHDAAGALSENEVDNYIDYSPHESGEEMEEVEGPDQEGSTSSSDKEHPSRGMTRVPKDMPPDQRPVIVPAGDSNWIEIEKGLHERQVNSVIGTLLRKHFPGLISTGPNKPASLAFTWKHYLAAKDKEHGSKAEWVLQEVWKYFACPEENLAEARLNIEKVAKKRLPDLKHSLRYQAVQQFYGPGPDGTPKVKKAEACNDQN